MSTHLTVDKSYTAQWVNQPEQTFKLEILLLAEYSVEIIIFYHCFVLFCFILFYFISLSVHTAYERGQLETEK